MNQPTLRDKTISGIFWSLMQNVGGNGITFIVMIILARLLTPEIFGLIGMLMIFIQVSQALVVAGFNQALIQKKDTDEEDYSSVFWINLLISMLLYGILFFCAPLIADFYQQPILIDLVRALSLVFVINAFSYVQEARLSKEMRFKTLTLVSIPSTIIGGVVSIVMAFMGFGVWSIIVLQLVTRLAFAIQIWCYAKWKPMFTYNASKVKQLFSFGSKLMVSAILNTVYQNIYLVMIGKFFPVSAVGYYQNAFMLAKMPAAIFSKALIKVAFPVFSSIQDDNKKLREGFKKAVQQIFFWLCPALVFAAIMAFPIFRLILTEKWIPSVPYFRILCVVGLLAPLNQFNLNIINVKGKSGLFLKLEIFKKMLMTIGVFISIQFGIFTLLFFSAIFSVFAYLINSYFVGKFIQYPVSRQIRDISSVFLLSGIMGIGLLIMHQYLIGLSDFLNLIICFFFWGTGYWFCAKIFKIQPYIELQAIIKSKKNGFY